ncbi:glycosyltransferase family 4 protein [Opitutales bacterium ASA1]|uniref:glycosyltransferase n=1 Tax=Congregicoccus parvus TaxID=3081749 RepID=UPI002B2F2421|nr:glycosyltransferase family 4 protein [Opitutales bacterium ASA1]
MKICFFTNTFLPHVGGVARSVQTFLEDYRRARHRVLVVAPEFPEGPAPRRIERSVVRTRALQQFNGSDFSVSLPLAAEVTDRIEKFRPQILHTHHPFLLGDSALRIGASMNLPVIFTHHTLYEQYTHYVPFDSEPMKDFVVDLTTRFANCCSAVFAPSESVAKLLAERGVEKPVHVIPTGIDTRRLATGRREIARKRFGIPEQAVVVGHVGRLAAEKNLGFLTHVLARSATAAKRLHVLVVGDGPERASMQAELEAAGLGERIHFAGTLSGRPLIDAYAAMDVFAFASHSETQGMVLAEAMSAGLPVVALDASGVRDTMTDALEGRLLPSRADEEAFTSALLSLVRAKRVRLRHSEAARRRAADFDRRVTAERAIAVYKQVREEHLRRHPEARDPDRSFASMFLDRLGIEGRLAAAKVGAAVRAVTESTKANFSAASS